MVAKKRTILLNKALNDLGFKCMWSCRVMALQSWSCCFQVRFICMRDNAAALHVISEEGREAERGCSDMSKHTLSVIHGLHAQWRGDDVEPWRKCPHLRQSSCACPSRLAALEHPFKHPSTPYSSACLSPHILSLWSMCYDTRMDHSPLLSLLTVEALLLMLLLSSVVIY